VERRDPHLRDLPRTEWNLAEQASEEPERSGLRPRRPLWAAGGAAGEDRDLRCGVRFGRVAGIAALDQRLERVVALLVGPGAVAAPGRVVDSRERFSVLVVVDEQVGAFAFGHLADLGAGEGGV